MNALSALRCRLLAGARWRRAIAAPERSANGPRPAAFRSGFTLIELVIVIGVILLLTAITATVVVGLQSRSEIRETENTMRLLETALSEWELATGRPITFGISGTGGPTGEPCSENEQYEIHQIAGPNPGWADDTAAQRDALITTDRLWAILARSTVAHQIIAQIDPAYLIELDPANEDDAPVHFGLSNLNHLNGRVSYRMLDAWENPILAILPGRVYNAQCGDSEYCVDALSAPCANDDGTIRTPYENRFGVAVNRRIFFVSAGPAGNFGDLRLSKAFADLTLAEVASARLAADNIYSYDVQIEQARP